MSHVFEIPQEEHPFEYAYVKGQRIFLRLRLEIDEYEQIGIGYFLEIDVLGRVKRTTVAFDYSSRVQFPRSAEPGDEFPMYGLHAAGQLYCK
jgi:hypothetical protein